MSNEHVKEPFRSIIEPLSPPKFNGLHPKTNALVFADGRQREAGIDPATGKYSTAQMMFDEIYGGDVSQPLFD